MNEHYVSKLIAIDERVMNTPIAIQLKDMILPMYYLEKKFGNTFY